MKSLDELLECLRERFDDGTDPHLWGVYIDMIKSAVAREREAVTDCNHTGNAAAMRESVEAYISLWNNGTMNDLDKLRRVVGNMRAALAAPPRQCDVGTAEDQAVRFRDMCNKYYDDENPCNKKCPLASLSIIHGFPRCQAYWAQTPYEAEEGAGE